MEKMLSFHDVSFNSTGRFPLYMNFKSFLHVYFRHTEELNVSTQFYNRDKFQLEENYYNVDVNPDGSISTFYKGTGNKK